MKNGFGNTVTLTLFGESHGEGIGVVIDGLEPGLCVDPGVIAEQLTLRRPEGEISTARAEKDEFRILSGVFEGRTTGTPLCIMIPNRDTDSGSYAEMRALARPGHADYTAYRKYLGFEDYRGGGHFSGRITAALVAAGAIFRTALSERGILIGTHIRRIGGAEDAELPDDAAVLTQLNQKKFAVVDEERGELMRGEIRAASAENDSVGGILETVVLGMPAGVGEPWFDTVEGMLSHALFSIPAVKAVSFGDGFGFAGLRGSEANDPFRVRNGKTVTATNRNGGINGGITNGMPIRFSVAVKPTPSIGREQETVNFRTGENAEICVGGRHDPCIVPRARAVVDAVTSFVLYDLLTGTYPGVKKDN